MTVGSLKMRRANLHRNESSAHHNVASSSRGGAGYTQYSQEEWDEWKKKKAAEWTQLSEKDEKPKVAEATPSAAPIAPSKALHAGHMYVVSDASPLLSVPLATAAPSKAASSANSDPVPAGTAAKTRPTSNKIGDNNCDGGGNLRAGIVKMHTPIFGESAACPKAVEPYQPWDLRCRTQEHLLALQAYAEYLYAGGEVITLPTGVKKARTLAPTSKAAGVKMKTEVEVEAEAAGCVKEEPETIDDDVDGEAGEEENIVDAMAQPVET